jgi:hypothetical protein
MRLEVVMFLLLFSPLGLHYRWDEALSQLLSTIDMDSCKTYHYTLYVSTKIQCSCHSLSDW